MEMESKVNSDGRGLYVGAGNDEKEDFGWMKFL